MSNIQQDWGWSRVHTQQTRKSPTSSNTIEHLWETPNRFATIWAGYLVQDAFVEQFINTLKSITVYLESEIDLYTYTLQLLKRYILHQKNIWDRSNSEMFAHVSNKLTFETNAISYINSLSCALESILRDYKSAIGWNANGNVYFLLAEEPKLVKIGFQSAKNNPRSRSIHSHCPYDLQLLGTMTVGHGIRSEQIIHRDFKYWHYNREWFRYDDEVERRIKFYLNRGYYDDCVKAMKYKLYNISEFITAKPVKLDECLTPYNFMMHELQELFKKYNSKPVQRIYLLKQ